MNTLCTIASKIVYGSFGTFLAAMSTFLFVKETMQLCVLISLLSLAIFFTFLGIEAYAYDKVHDEFIFDELN